MPIKEPIAHRIGQISPISCYSREFDRPSSFDDLHLLRDGVELVVVTMRAGESQAKQRLADPIDLQVYDIHLQLPFVCVHKRPRSKLRKPVAITCARR